MSESGRSVGVLTTDAQLVVTTWDAWLARVTGIAPEAARGRSLSDLVPDLQARGLAARLREVLHDGVVVVLAPAFHHYLIPCPPRHPSRFDTMQQHVTITPLREGERIVGLLAMIEDVTARMDLERELAERLASADEGVRVRAIEQLAVFEKEPPRALVGALGDQSWRVRQAAAYGLARYSQPEMIEALLSALRDGHHNLGIVHSTLQVLALTAADAVEPLARILHDADPALRIYAALALGEQRDPRAVEALVGALRDSDANVRYHAIEALGKLRAASAEALDALIGIVETRGFFLAFPALDALVRAGDSRIASRLVPLLDDDLLRIPAADALGQLGDEEVIEPLARLLNRPGAPVRGVAQALAALHDRYERLYGEGAHIADLASAAISPGGAANLLRALDEAEPDELEALTLLLSWLEGHAVERALARLLGRPSVRRAVVEALARRGPRVTTLLIEQLAAKDLEIRSAAAVALGRIGDPRAVPALTAALHDDPALAILAAEALAKIGDLQAVDALLALLGNPNAAVRQAAIAALNSLGHPAMPGRVAVLLADPDPRIRESAAKIAGYFGYPNCVERLLALCWDPNESVRIAALDHVPYLDDARVLPMLAEVLASAPPRVRAAAARALGHVDAPAALAHLLAALGDGDPWVRYFAARSLGRRPDPGALSALAAAARQDSAYPVRAAAIEALGAIGGPPAVAVLAPLAESKQRDLSRAATLALGMAGCEDALPPLFAALRSPDPAWRVDALHALRVCTGEAPGRVEAVRWVAASDETPQVVHAAVGTLAHLATPDAIAALVALAAAPATREPAVEALGGLAEEHAEAVARGLLHDNAQVRCAVVDALARMKRPFASELLATALDDGDAGVRLAAATALGQLGSRRAERKLATMARSDPDPHVRAAAWAALRR